MYNKNRVSLDVILILNWIWIFKIMWTKTLYIYTCIHFSSDYSATSSRLAKFDFKDSMKAVPEYKYFPGLKLSSYTRIYFHPSLKNLLLTTYLINSWHFARFGWPENLIWQFLSRQTQMLFNYFDLQNKMHFGYRNLSCFINNIWGVLKHQKHSCQIFILTLFNL